MSSLIRPLHWHAESFLDLLWAEADLSTIDPGASLRDQLDIDSVDFLNFVIAIHSELGVEIPEADLPKLSTLNGCVAYLFSKATP